MIEPNTGPRSVKSLVTVYTPESPLRQPRKFVRELISDLWGSRELAWRLFVRDLRAQYRASLLGYLWVFLPPLVAGLPFGHSRINLPLVLGAPARVRSGSLTLFP